MKRFPSHLLVTLFILFVSMPVNGVATDLDQVLQKHFAALGNRDSVMALSSVATYFSITYMGLPAQSVTMIELPDRYYDRLEAPFGVLEGGFDGTIGWMTDANRYTRPASDEDLKSIMNNLYLIGLSYTTPENFPGSTVYVGDTVIGNDALHHLKLYPPGGDSLSMLIDSADGRIVHEIQISDGTILVTEYGDFRTVSGISVPFSSATHSPNGPYEFASHIDSIFLNRDIPDSIFVMPGKRVDFEFTGGVDSIVVPMGYGPHGISIPVMVDGQGPFRFLLDTGCSATLIGKPLAARLGIYSPHRVPSQGIGGFGEIGYGQVDSIGIGELSWRLNHISIFDLAFMGTGGPDRIDGMLGYDFFTRFPMRLDFRRWRLVLYNPDSNAKASMDRAVPISIYRRIPLIDAVIDGVPARLALDLGAGSALFMQQNSRWYSTKGEIPEARGNPTELRGMGGTVSAVSVPVKTVDLGSIKLTISNALVPTGETQVAYSDYIEGLLGCAALLGYALLVDYENQRIYLEEDTGANK